MARGPLCADKPDQSIVRQMVTRRIAARLRLELHHPSPCLTLRRHLIPSSAIVVVISITAQTARTTLRLHHITEWSLIARRKRQGIEWRGIVPNTLGSSCCRPKLDDLSKSLSARFDRQRCRGLDW